LIETELKNHENTEKAIGELEKLRKELAFIPVTNQSYGLVHYDFEPDNVFYNEESNHCEVIDFEDGMYHWFMVDIEQYLGELKEEMEECQFKNTKMKFLEGYRSEFTLTDEMLELLPLMRRFINLYSYTRILYSTSEWFENEPDWLVDLRKKLDFKMMELTNSMG
jgi:Ser/Thr protein kinase RdoA (MazF antagonist)